MRIDHEKRHIHCSVGDLVQERTYRRIGVERGEGFRRMWIGQDIHSGRADLRMGEDPNYRAEVHVVHRTACRGWEVTITGRIDGASIDRAARRIVLEEVKSLHFDLELEALQRSEKLQRHLFQLLLYAFFLSRQEEFAEFAFAPQLVLIDIASGETLVVDSEFDRQSVEEALAQHVERVVDEIESASALREAKKAAAENLGFPFPDVRPYQDEIVEAVGRAIREREALLVSAPTGIGKTMAALYPAVREALATGKKVFFLTPKTLQQETAVRALDMLNDGSFRVLRIRAKQKMCAHTQMICHEDFCPFAERYSAKMDRSGLRQRIVDTMPYFDPDITFELARSEEVCPFEVSLELIEEADVIVCDYNYIFDPWVSLKAWSDDKDYGDAILIVDEAHNLVDRGRGYHSPELNESMLEAVRNHLISRNCWIEGWEEELELLRAHIGELGAGLEESQPQALCRPDRELFLAQRAAWERILMTYITWKIENRIVEDDDPVVDFYFKLVKFTNVLMEEGDEFSHIIARQEGRLRLSILCKDPSRFLGAIFESAHAVIALSATLEPFDFYRRMFGFPNERTVEVSLPSPFPKENRKVVVVSTVDTTFRSRSRHYDAIAANVAGIASATRGNFLALFPSYAFLREVSALIPPITKRVMVQRNDMTDYERQAILQVLREKPVEGNLILAVSGGMYAEGIDYRGEMLAGVMVVGPALPQVSFEQELLKQYFDERYGSGFEFAYLIPGMTRVVQSAGRVIRSESDVGVIALLCRRFTQEQYTRYFPREWYEESPAELVSRDAAGSVRSFFEKRNTRQLRLLGPELSPLRLV